MIRVIFERLSKRQQAYREVCERFGITIGDDSYSGGEDAALYFTVLNDEGVECAPECEVERYCVVTSGGDFHYAYAYFETLAAAKRKGDENIGDSIYSELPVEIVNLATGKRYLPTIKARWSALEG